jgi:hypothetical protein
MGRSKLNTYQVFYHQGTAKPYTRHALVEASTPDFAIKRFWRTHPDRSFVADRVSLLHYGRMTAFDVRREELGRVRVKVRKGG